VNEPIELTDSQVNDVARQLPKDYDLLVKQSQVSVMVRLINKVRDGDPVGTVRRYDGSRSIAIRRDYGWLLIHEDHIEELKPHNRLHLPQWPLVYSPEA
jgi:hypothetical protein